ncbi:hippurate hydrolase [Palleronia marisminoris]|uniref:Putative hydrolase YxeP n=1 Tax=Palleronia marisminoris TaxID=315423 RepID=A0A1Y5TEW4_9RHOB|nr:M20 aminoacylase family protein [Palleronia marisminoris]SFH33809.1 hippurate hydrolase [Palleronia marisminoris]SLN60324.1 putative hydrolase YxeP [Palleronia marisminoris]
MPIRNRIADMAPEIAAWRQHLHRRPELGFDTHETSAFVADKLREIGCDDVVTGIGRTGVVGLIHGKGGPGRCVGLRADMDALPITEATGAAYASEVRGKMHACGHDGHTAMLLGAARYLAETRAFGGTVAVIFQPAEEGGGGGEVMVQDGMMDRFGIEEVYGMHNWPGLPLGSFAIRAGAFFAATDVFEIDVIGQGGHAAKPHETIDATVVAAEIVGALQTIASRVADPTKQVVVSVTSFETSSTAFNVIPGRVHMKGTVRTLEPEVQDMAEARIARIAEGIAGAHGAEAQVRYERNYPVMANHHTETAYAAEAARAVAGDCAAADLVMGGEDFAYMLEARPGAYILVGNGDTAPLHSAKFDFDDNAIPAGVSYWATLVEQRLPAA